MSTSTLARPSAETESGIETVPYPSGTILERSRGVTVVSSFTVTCDREPVWTETWQALKQIALSKPECQGFRILRDQKDVTRFLVLSEWPDTASYDRFIRETSLVWLERVMPGLCPASESTLTDSVTGGR